MKRALKHSIRQRFSKTPEKRPRAWGRCCSEPHALQAAACEPPQAPRLCTPVLPLGQGRVVGSPAPAVPGVSLAVSTWRPQGTEPRCLQWPARGRRPCHPEPGEERGPGRTRNQASLIRGQTQKGPFIFFFFSKSYIINKRVCTFAMIHWRVKGRRYKYRYGCNVKKPPQIKPKNRNPTWGRDMRAHAALADIGGRCLQGTFHVQTSPPAKSCGFQSPDCRSLPCVMLDK